MKNLNLLLICVCVFIVSCNPDEDEAYLHPNAGKYELISLTSSVPMDFDYDGIYGTDFKAELDRLWFSQLFNAQSPPLEIRSFSTLDSDGIRFVAFNMFGMATDNYNPDHPTLEQRFQGNDRQKYLKLIEGREPLVEYAELQFPLSANRVAQLPVTHSFVFVNTDTITMDMTQRFYDIWNDEWKDVELHAVFNKVENFAW